MKRAERPRAITPPQRWVLTFGFSIVATAIVVGSLIYTQQLVRSLVLREQRLVRFYADILQSFASANSTPIESLFLLDRVTPTIDFPCIITDSMGMPLEPYEQFTLNIALDRLGSHDKQRTELHKMIAEMAAEYPPIEVRDPGGKVVNYIYFTNSWVVKRLRVLPYVEFALVALFIAAGYGALMMQRRRDESLIWVGMAKETAHQLGTPISSLFGWLELLGEHLASDTQNTAQLETTLGELRRDVERLRGIAERFSAIGSAPRLSRADISTIIENAQAYMRPRLPRHGRTLTIEWERPKQCCFVMANEELLAWVFENLIKNAAEAIEQQQGRITITATEIARGKRHFARVTVTDTGKGMSPMVRRSAFSAGFTTKERGWGLGLALAKRIVEQYHRGRIFIVHTEPGRGTTVAVELPCADSSRATEVVGQTA
ncbi:MAG: two-component sensor histidine kinase [Candidatus Kapaibacterium sp.]|nr:MAG: two-component sensor histidine kinase [Candidatus Kapabacteria bacterium]